jgi:aspartyl-tRNA(Asn)/glutamyl-tRNA(Gln) amidotransferase subunit C
MSVTLQDVAYVAALARLSFTPDEMSLLTAQLNTILTHMDQLNTLNTDNVDPLAQVIELSNVFREDRQTPGLTREAALQNAPSQNGVFFKVPKVIGER